MLFIQIFFKTQVAILGYFHIPAYVQSDHLYYKEIKYTTLFHAPVICEMESPLTPA